MSVTSTSSPTCSDSSSAARSAPDQWRSFRLLRGTYGQRQAADAQMMRVKIPQGVLSTPQLHALAEVAERYSRGFGHITTRQNIQFHFVRAARRGARDAAPGGCGFDDA